MPHRSAELVQKALSTGRKLLDRGWYDEAISVIGDARLLAPDHVELVLLHAECLARQKKMVEALELLVDASREQPGHADLRLRLGQFLAAEGLHVAMDLFDRCETEHEHPALVILERAMTLSDMGRFRDAEVEATRAIDLEPEYVDAWMELGRLKIEMGDWAGAVRPLRRAMELEAGNDELVVDLAAAYMHQGFIEEAARVLDRLPNSDHPGLAYYRAAVAASRGDNEAALGFLKTALSAGHDGIRRLLDADRFFDGLREHPALADLKGTAQPGSNLRRLTPRKD